MQNFKDLKDKAVEYAEHNTKIKDFTQFSP